MIEQRPKSRFSQGSLAPENSRIREQLSSWALFWLLLWLLRPKRMVALQSVSQRGLLPKIVLLKSLSICESQLGIARPDDGHSFGIRTDRSKPPVKTPRKHPEGIQKASKRSRLIFDISSLWAFSLCQSDIRHRARGTEAERIFRSLICFVYFQ